MARRIWNPYRRSVLLAVCGATLSLSVLGAETYRFAEKPWGYSSPAGRCTICHSLKPDTRQPVAPTLWRIVGAEKGRARSWFAYSPALLQKGGNWSAAELDKYLADPGGFLPGTNKSISVASEKERNEIIGYLEKLK